MKKFLSVVLALVMTMSLVTIAAGAKDFTDDSKIAYNEAVDVISATKVVDGYTDGSFNPSATLTRGAAAKIICNLILGPTTGSSLTADAAPFKDVPASNVFAGYIAYCSQQKIISGYADGAFKPAGTVTGYQFLKMLLGALGYNSTNEGFTGANWSVNVAKLASSLELTKSNDSFVGSAAMTREEACLYAYNTLKATMVKYDNSGTSITVGGTTITTSPSKAESLENTATQSTQTIKHDGYMQFGEKYFKDLKLTSSASDAFGRPSNTWKYKTTEVGTYAKTADASYTEEVKLGTIYSDLGLGSTLAAKSITGYRNGVANSALTTKLASGVAKNSDTKIGGNGVLTEVYYDSDAETATIVLIDTYGGKVAAKRDATSVADAYVNINAQNNSGASAKFETTAFDVDDIVTYNYSLQSGEGIKNVAKAEQVTGTMTGYTSGKSVTVGGTTYKLNAAYTDDITDKLAGAVKYDVTLTLDKNGYVVDVDTEATSTNYAVVIKVTGEDTWNDAKARLLFTDGTTKDVVLSNSTVSSNVIDAGKNTQYITKNDLVSYRVSSSDKYSLTLLANESTKANATIISKGDSGISLTANVTGNTTTAQYANGKTIFLVATKSGSDTIYTAYTGIANVPTIKATTATDVTVATYCKSGTTATLIFIDATSSSATSVTSSSKDVIFVKGSDSTGMSHDSVKGDYWNYKAVINGEITTIDSANKISDYTMYDTVSYDKNNVATLTVNTTDVKGNGGTITGTVKASNNVIGLGSNYYSYTKDCKVFIIDTDGNISASSIGAISTNPDTAKDTVYFKLTDGDVSTIVIKEYKASTTPTVNTDDYAITFNGNTIDGVNYYTGKDHDNDAIVNVIQSILVNTGYTVSKVNYDGSAYTFSTTKGIVSADLTWTPGSAVPVECYKVSVNGTAQLVAKGTAISALPSAGKYVKIDGATPVLVSGAGNIVDGKSYDVGYYMLTVDSTDSFLKVGAKQAITGTGTGYVKSAAYTAYGDYTMTAADTTIATGYVSVAAAAAGTSTGDLAAATIGVTPAAASYVKVGNTVTVEVTIPATAAAVNTNGVTATVAVTGATAPAAQDVTLADVKAGKTLTFSITAGTTNITAITVTFADKA